MASREDVARALAGLGAAYDRIAAAMFAIDGHPGLAYLRGGGLSGATRQRAAALDPEVDLMWAQFAVLGEKLDQVRALAGGGRLDDDQRAQADRLLAGPVVALDAAGLPVDGAAVPATTLRLGDLAAGLERRCAAVTAHLSEVDGAWSAVAGRLAPLTEALDELVALAGPLGAAQIASDLRVRLEEIARVDLGDPLAAAPGGRLSSASQVRITELSGDLTKARDRLRELAAIRDGYPGRLAALAALVDQVASAEQAVVSANAQATAKILSPGLDVPPAATAILRARLPELDRLHREAQWSRLVDTLSTVESSARRALERAGQLRANADALVARRDELRGRLDAYRAKAAARGLVEAPRLVTLYDTARGLLYTAPCDLRAATRALHDFQQALAELETATPVRSDVDD